MPREAALFELAGGSPLQGFMILKQGGGNIPPQWVERAAESRKNRHADVVRCQHLHRIDHHQHRHIETRSYRWRYKHSSRHNSCRDIGYSRRGS